MNTPDQRTRPRSPYLQYAGKASWGGHDALAAAALGDSCAPDVVEGIRDCLHYYSTDPADAIAGSFMKQVSAPAQSTYSAGKPTAGSIVDLAVLDEGIPVAKSTLLSRLKAVWVQDGAPSGDHASLVPFGRDFSATEIQKLLKTRKIDPIAHAYDEIARSDVKGMTTRRRLRRFATHGAAVVGELLHGRNAQHPVIAVNLPPEIVRDTSGSTLPYYALLGLLYAMAVSRASASEENGQRSIVATLSYGVLAGPKDGTGMFERALDLICDPHSDFGKVGSVHCVLPMGNGRQSRAIAQLTTEEARKGISLRLPPADSTPTFVEIYAEHTLPQTVVLQRRGGEKVVLQVPTEQNVEVEVDGYALLRVNAGVLLAIPPTSSKAIKKDASSKGRGSHVIKPGDLLLQFPEATDSLNLCVQRDDSLDGLKSGGRQARFLDAAYEVYDAAGRPLETDTKFRSLITRAGTINALASGEHVWRAGGTYLRHSDHTVPYSGMDWQGSTRNAFGDALGPSDESPFVSGRAVRSVAGGAPVTMTGTSLAAPVVARHIADFIGDNGVGSQRSEIETYLDEQLQS